MRKPPKNRSKLLPAGCYLFAKREVDIITPLREIEAEEAAKEARKRPAAKRYSTDYAIEYGRKQGWKLVDREHYDARLKRHHDLRLGADALFETPTDFVLLQGAGRYERAEHRRRFEEGGGAASARKANCRFFYLEFERGTKEPLLTEEWT